MTPIERQILKNQATILKGLTGLSLGVETLLSINNRMEETNNLFKEKSEEPCCEMPEREETRE